MITWIYIVWICLGVQDPCPEGRVGCGVFHSHIECNESKAFLNRVDAVEFRDDTDPGIGFSPRNRLDSMTLEEYIDMQNEPNKYWQVNNAN